MAYFSDKVWFLRSWIIMFWKSLLAAIKSFFFLSSLFLSTLMSCSSINCYIIARYSLLRSNDLLYWLTFKVPVDFMVFTICLSSSYVFPFRSFLLLNLNFADIFFILKLKVFFDMPSFWKFFNSWNTLFSS